LSTLTPHKVVDRADELAIKQPQLVRETCLLCSKLGTNNPRPMGLADNIRVQTRSYPNLIPSEIEHEIACSEEEHAKISQEIKKLQVKGAIVEAQLSPLSFVSQIFLVEKKGGTEAGDKPQGPQQLCEDGAFQDEGPASSPKSNPEVRLDGEVIPKGCISPGPNSPGTSMSSTVSMGAQDLPICLLAIWPDISTPCFHKDNETSCGNTTSDGDSSDHISR